MQRRTFELQRYCLFRHNEQRNGRHKESWELLAALHKSVDKVYEAIEVDTKRVTRQAYVTWFDMLKAELPLDMQFGWLQPVTRTEWVTTNTTYNLVLRYYELMVAPENEYVVRTLLPEPDQALADIIYRDVWRR